MHDAFNQKDCPHRVHSRRLFYGRLAYSRYCMYYLLLNAMIPITESLNLSCDETGRLVQKLLDLKSKHNGIEFDDRIKECLDEFVKIKDKFAEAIDDYMHNDDNYISENIETVTAIVETCPKVLASEGG